jgi:hypothetical protein
MKKIVSNVCVMVMLVMISRAGAQDQRIDGSAAWMKIISPAESQEVVSKKPQVTIEFEKAYMPGSLVVILDSTDITQLGTVSEGRFEYRPVMVLPAGNHNLTVSAVDQEGGQVFRMISFTTRHSSAFDEIGSDNEAFILYEAALVRPDASAIPSSKIEGNLKSDSRLRTGGWEFGLSTNVRYFDQNHRVPTAGSGESPLRKGFGVMNFLLKGRYAKDDLHSLLEIGDVQINETQNTISGLARRGGKLLLNYGDYSLNTFSVKGQQVTGLRGGFGIEGTTDDHILGVSGGVKFLDKKAELRTVYVTGGEPGNSVGISTTTGPLKGDVLGFLLTTDFFENRIRTEMEADFSRFDPDTTDEFSRKNDHAYRLKAGGNISRYIYEAMYEYFGRDYAVIGNQGVRKDNEGVSFMNSLALDQHALSLLLSRYNDNVKGDDLFPRIVTSHGNLGYSFFGLPNLPLNLSYQKVIQESRREPSGTDPIERHTDTVTGNITYITGHLSLGFTGNYSLLNDRTPVNADTTSINYVFTPSYFMSALTLSPAFSLNRSKDHLSDVWTDTYTASMNMGTRLFRERASIDAGGTYTEIKADNDSVNTRNLSTNFRVGYRLKDLLRGMIDPTLALKGLYTKITDKVNSAASMDEFSLFLMLSMNMPFSL